MSMIQLKYAMARAATMEGRVKGNTVFSRLWYFIREMYFLYSVGMPVRW